MATFTGGMFGRVRAALGLGPAPSSSPAEVAHQPAEQELTAVRRDLERRRARYLAEVQAERAHQAAMAQAVAEAERARQARAREEILEIIARSDHGCYFPGDRLVRRERSWLGRVVDLFRAGG